MDSKQNKLKHNVLQKYLVRFVALKLSQVQNSPQRRKVRRGPRRVKIEFIFFIAHSFYPFL